MRSITRRKSIQWAVKGTFASSLLLNSAWSSVALAALESEDTKNTFMYGVASGDPTQNSLIIWTKINTESSKPETVNWLISTDVNFKRIIQSGTYQASSDSGYSVKVDIKNLDPGVRYYYKFIYNGIESEPGRTRTLPSGDLSKLSIAIASCSNFPFGYFNAYDAIAKDESIDFVVHLGDYIYEYGPDGYGGETGKKIGREHIPAREILSLSDYRLRHAQYKSDLASRLMHAAHPLIPTWDDHESTNNPYMDGAQNHQENEGSWQHRREVSLQAYFEWMPVRDPAPGERKEELWRAFNFGNLATMVTLETRHTGRSKQIDYKEHLPNIKSKSDRDHFVSEILGDTSRTMLSPKMTEFLRTALTNSVQHDIPWRIIGNQIPMARTHVPRITDELLKQLEITEDSPLYNEVQQFKALGEWDLPIYSDTWDGYPVAREQFYSTCAEAGASDLLVITGDSHAYWLNKLFNISGKHMGFEVGTTGVTSPGDFEYFGKDKATILDKLMAAKNDEVLWTDNVSKGYVRLSFTKEDARVDYIAVDNILSPEYKTSVVKSLKFKPNNGALTLEQI